MDAETSRSLALIAETMQADLALRREHLQQKSRNTDISTLTTILQSTNIPEGIRTQAEEQLRALLESRPPLNEDRLAQEAALLATRGDIREEIDRLRAHCEAALETIAKPGAVGRQLDFLAQEFNREANTLCSKSADVELTRIGLDLKTTIDQFREQIQNVE